MAEFSGAEILQATALALMRHSVVESGGTAPVLRMVSTAFGEGSGMLEVTYARRSEPVVLTYAEEAGTVRYTCLSNRYAILLTPRTPIYEQEEPE